MATRILPEASGASVDDRVRAVVRTLLGAADMKAGDLARGIGMTKAQVWDRQRGDKAWTVQEVAVLAEFFDIPVGIFLAGPAALLGRSPSTHETTGREFGLGTERETTRSSSRAFRALRVAA
jgi:hypothetical protein